MKLTILLALAVTLLFVLTHCGDAGQQRGQTIREAGQILNLVTIIADQQTDFFDEKTVPDKWVDVTERFNDALVKIRNKYPPKIDDWYADGDAWKHPYKILAQRQSNGVVNIKTCSSGPDGVWFNDDDLTRVQEYKIFKQP